ncbi:hypothetical protein R1sor_018551 [Riccia sorocarpa]|uniref:Uncharacterized protein n=1 Tax=Riccia sorocarpa TaxID=122646 RepID=A0ABD3IDB0_9MARC
MQNKDDSFHTETLNEEIEVLYEDEMVLENTDTTKHVEKGDGRRTKKNLSEGRSKVKNKEVQKGGNDSESLNPFLKSNHARNNRSRDERRDDTFTSVDSASDLVKADGLSSESKMYDSTVLDENTDSPKTKETQKFQRSDTEESESGGTYVVDDQPGTPDTFISSREDFDAETIFTSSEIRVTHQPNEEDTHFQVKARLEGAASGEKYTVKHEVDETLVNQRLMNRKCSTKVSDSHEDLFLVGEDAFPVATEVEVRMMTDDKVRFNDDINSKETYEVGVKMMTEDNMPLNDGINLRETSAQGKRAANARKARVAKMKRSSIKGTTTTQKKRTQNLKDGKNMLDSQRSKAQVEPEIRSSSKVGNNRDNLETNEICESSKSVELLMPEAIKAEGLRVEKDESVNKSQERRSVSDKMKIEDLYTGNRRRSVSDVEMVKKPDRKLKGKDYTSCEDGSGNSVLTMNKTEMGTKNTKHNTSILNMSKTEMETKHTTDNTSILNMSKTEMETKNTTDNTSDSEISTHLNMGEPSIHLETNSSMNLCEESNPVLQESEENFKAKDGKSSEDVKELEIREGQQNNNPASDANRIEVETGRSIVDKTSAAEVSTYFETGESRTHRESNSSTKTYGKTNPKLEKSRENAKGEVYQSSEDWKEANTRKGSKQLNDSVLDTKKIERETRIIADNTSDSRVSTESEMGENSRHRKSYSSKKASGKKTVFGRQVKTLRGKQKKNSGLDTSKTEMETKEDPFNTSDTLEDSSYSQIGESSTHRGSFACGEAYGEANPVLEKSEENLKGKNYKSSEDWKQVKTRKGKQLDDSLLDMKKETKSIADNTSDSGVSTESEVGETSIQRKSYPSKKTTGKTTVFGKSKRKQSKSSEHVKQSRPRRSTQDDNSILDMSNIETERRKSTGTASDTGVSSHFELGESSVHRESHSSMTAYGETTLSLEKSEGNQNGKDDKSSEALKQTRKAQQHESSPPVISRRDMKTEKFGRSTNDISDMEASRHFEIGESSKNTRASSHMRIDGERNSLVGESEEQDDNQTRSDAIDDATILHENDFSRMDDRPVDENSRMKTMVLNLPHDSRINNENERQKKENRKAENLEEICEGITKTSEKHQNSNEKVKTVRKVKSRAGKSKEKEQFQLFQQKDKSKWVHPYGEENTTTENIQVKELTVTNEELHDVRNRVRTNIPTGKKLRGNTLSISPNKKKLKNQPAPKTLNSSGTRWKSNNASDIFKHPVQVRRNEDDDQLRSESDPQKDHLKSHGRSDSFGSTRTLSDINLSSLTQGLSHVEHFNTESEDQKSVYGTPPNLEIDTSETMAYLNSDTGIKAEETNIEDMSLPTTSNIKKDVDQLTEFDSMDDLPKGSRNSLASVVKSNTLQEMILNSSPEEETDDEQAVKPNSVPTSATPTSTIYPVHDRDDTKRPFMDSFNPIPDPSDNIIKSDLSSMTSNASVSSDALSAESTKASTPETESNYRQVTRSAREPTTNITDKDDPRLKNLNTRITDIPSTSEESNIKECKELKFGDKDAKNTSRDITPNITETFLNKPDMFSSENIEVGKRQDASARNYKTTAGNKATVLTPVNDHSTESLNFTDSSSANPENLARVIKDAEESPPNEISMGGTDELGQTIRRPFLNTTQRNGPGESIPTRSWSEDDEEGQKYLRKDDEEEQVEKGKFDITFGIPDDISSSVPHEYMGKDKLQESSTSHPKRVMNDSGSSSLSVVDSSLDTSRVEDSVYLSTKAGSGYRETGRNTLKYIISDLNNSEMASKQSVLLEEKGQDFVKRCLADRSVNLDIPPNGTTMIFSKEEKPEGNSNMPAPGASAAVMPETKSMETDERQVSKSSIGIEGNQGSEKVDTETEEMFRIKKDRLDSVVPDYTAHDVIHIVSTSTSASNNAIPTITGPQPEDKYEEAKDEAKAEDKYDTDKEQVSKSSIGTERYKVSETVEDKTKKYILIKKDRLDSVDYDYTAPEVIHTASTSTSVSRTAIPTVASPQAEDQYEEAEDMAEAEDKYETQKEQVSKLCIGTEGYHGSEKVKDETEQMFLIEKDNLDRVVCYRTPDVIHVVSTSTSVSKNHADPTVAGPQAEDKYKEAEDEVDAVDKHETESSKASKNAIPTIAGPQPEDKYEDAKDEVEAEDKYKIDEEQVSKSSTDPQAEDKYEEAEDEVETEDKHETDEERISMSSKGTEGYKGSEKVKDETEEMFLIKKDGLDKLVCDYTEPDVIHNASTSTSASNYAIPTQAEDKYEDAKEKAEAEDIYKIDKKQVSKPSIGNEGYQRSEKVKDENEEILLIKNDILDRVVCDYTASDLIHGASTSTLVSKNAIPTIAGTERYQGSEKVEDKTEESVLARKDRLDRVVCDYTAPDVIHVASTSSSFSKNAIPIVTGPQAEDECQQPHEGNMRSTTEEFTRQLSSHRTKDETIGLQLTTFEHGVPLSCSALETEIISPSLSRDLSKNMAPIQTSSRDFITLRKLTPLTLGLETVGGVMTPIIPRNTTLPVHRRQLISTHTDNQTEVLVHIFEGERLWVRENKILGSFEIKGIARAPRGEPLIPILFEIDAQGILNVLHEKVERAGEQTRRRLTLAISNVSVRPDRQKILQMIQDAAKHKAEDDEHRKRIQLKESFEDYVFRMRNIIIDKRIDKLVDPKEKEEMLAAVRSALNWLNVSNWHLYNKRQVPDFQEINSQRKSLQKICDAVIGKILQRPSKSTHTGS